MSIQVRSSNDRCIQFGGANCQLNYEVMKTHTIRVHVTDNGTVALSAEFDITITVTDKNDPPRNMQISNQTVCFKLYRFSIYRNEVSLCLGQ